MILVIKIVAEVIPKMTSLNANLLPVVGNDTKTHARDGRSIGIDIPLAPNVATTVDPSSLISGHLIEAIQGLFIDNSGNSSPLYLYVSGTLLKYVVDPYTQGYISIISNDSSIYTFITAASVTVRAVFLNSRTETYLWSVAALSGGIAVADTVLDGCVHGGILWTADQNLTPLIVGGKLAVQDSAAETSLSTLAGTVSGSKIQVSDAAIEGLIGGGKLSVQDAAAETALATLAGTVSGSKIQVSDAAIEGLIGGGKLAVQDSAAETSLSTLAGTVSGAKIQVVDTAAETSLATLAGTVSSAQLATSNAVLASCISGGYLRIDPVMRLGANRGTLTGTTTIVTAAANTTGITLRTLTDVSGGNVSVGDGTNYYAVLSAYSGLTYALYFPPGTQIIVYAVNPTSYSYDVGQP